jgi:hypothetical protein
MAALVISGDTSGTVTIAAPAIAGTQTYTLPTAVPASNGQVLSSTTTGVLSWASGAVGYTGSTGTGYTGSAGAGGSPAGSSNYVQYNNSGAFGATSNFVWENGTTVGAGTSSPSTYGDGAYGFVAYGSAANARGHISLGGNNTTADEVMGKIHFFNSNSTNAIYRVCAIQAARGADNNSGHLIFQTANSGAPSERVRINSTGTVLINCTTTTPPGNANIKFNPAGQVVFAQGTVTTGDVAKGMVNFLPYGCSTNNTNSEAWADLATGVFIDSQIENGNIALCNSALLIRGQVGGSGSPGALIRAGTGGNGSSSFTQQFRVLYNGNVANTNGTYGSLSDVRAKQDITDAASQWNDIKAIRVRKYRLISDVERSVATGIAATYQIGVVAQELRQTSPGLVEDNGDENNMMTVKSSIMYMKAIKALQEAMNRIETLETEVAALKAR